VTAEAVLTRQPAATRSAAAAGQPSSGRRARAFTALLLDALLAEMARLGVRVIRAGNLLRAPLTLEGVLEHLPGPERRVVLLVERAGTLHPEALRSLQARMLRSPPDARPSLEVVFVGRPAFRDLLVGADLAPLRQTLAEPVGGASRPVAALHRGKSAPAPRLPGSPDWGLPELATIRPTRRRGRALTFALVIAALLGGGATVAYVGLRAMPDPDVASQPVAEAVAPAAPAPLPPLPSAPPAPTGARSPQASSAAAQPARRSPALAASRTASRTWDFDAYVLRSGRDPATLTGAERSASFDEFLASRSRHDASGAPAGVAPRIVIHVPTGSSAAEALSGRLLASLGAHPGSVEARHVAATPNRPTIRFFHPEDEPAARQAAGWMAEAGLPWTVRDFSGYQPTPSRGTIEVWLP